MPVINGVYLKDFAALPSAVDDANIIPIAISGNQVAYRTTVSGIITDARITGKLLTGLSVTGTAILATDTILQAFGKVQNQLNNRVSSVGLTMPSAFSVANSPITTSGTLEVTAIGSASQYIRGDGTLATIPSTSSGGANVNYYLNGSVSASVATYKQMSNSAVIGAGTDFNLTGNGLIAQFLTDAGNPNRLLIPGGAWNFEMYFNISSSGGNTKFYVELLKYDGTTFTSIASSSAIPEQITGGTITDLYITSLAVPETALLITDRLALRVYIVDNSGGRTVTLHTEDNTLCLVTTTFAGGIAALNGLTANTQYFAVGSTGTDFNISSSVDTHTFNIPSASASNRGLITTGTQTFAGDKTFTGNMIASPTTGSAIQAISTISNAIQVTSTSGNGVDSQTQTGAAISGNASGTLGYGVVGQASGTGGAGGYFTGSGIGYAVLATATGTSTTAFYGTANSGSSPVQRLVQFGAGSIAFFDNTSGTVASITNSGGLTLAGQLRLGSTITNGTYTYTLPSATGTLALTSALSAYLPLAGGTLTGNANFQLSNSASPSISIRRSSSSYDATINYNDNGSNRWTIGMFGDGSGDYKFYNYGSGANSIKIGYGTDIVTLTGALNGTSATFTGDITSSNGKFYVVNTYGYYFGGSANLTGFTGSNGTQTITAVTNNTTALTINSSQAATFSSTVGIGVTPSGTDGVLQITSSAGTLSGTAKRSVNINSTIAENADRPGIILGYDTAGAGVIAAATQSTGQPLAFWTYDGSSWGERMRITSAGYLKLREATSSTTEVHILRADTTTDAVVQVNNSNNSQASDGLLSIIATRNTSNNTFYAFGYYNAGAGAWKIRVADSGNVTNTNNSYGAISDIKLKENIVDATPKLENLLKVKIRNYNLIGEEIKQIGVIAQELEEIFPSMVDESEDFEEVEIIDEEGNTTKEKQSLGTTTKSVKMSVFVPMLIKAIQEQQAQIEELKALIKPTEPIVLEVIEPIVEPIVEPNVNESETVIE
jgi:hypothetical protein